MESTFKNYIGRYYQCTLTQQIFKVVQVINLPKNKVVDYVIYLDNIEKKSYRPTLQMTTYAFKEFIKFQKLINI